MKYTIFSIVTALGFVATYALALTTSRPSEEPNLQQLKRYHRITKVPFQMQDSTSLSCRPLSQVRQNPHEPSYPQTAFCDVYVNKLAKETIDSGQGKYPEGSLVIKSKLAKVDAKEAELFTIMQKMHPGYDQEHGDWKYSIFDGKTFRIIASGRIESCIDCHTSYSSTDFITRTYMKDIRVGYLPEYAESHPDIVGLTDSEFSVQLHLDLLGPNRKRVKQIILVFRKTDPIPTDLGKPIEVTGKREWIELDGPAGTKSGYSNESIKVESWRYLETSELPK
jgi:hypothetical protein